MSDSTLESPALMGFAELESAQVLSDLLEKSPLFKLNYQFVHYDSPDRRGIDVGLIYRKDLLRLVNSQTIRYVNPSEPEYRSRDMLYAEFEAKDGRHFHFVICHWPSRSGGQEASEPRRLQAAKLLGQFVDSLADESADPIILMGDFNDAPSNKSMHYLADSLAGLRFHNLMLDLNQELGSHRYRGEWAYLDQILVRDEYQKCIQQAATYSAEFLLEEETNYPGFKPKRAFKGSFLGDGYSDHLPVFVDYKCPTQP